MSERHVRKFLDASTAHIKYKTTLWLDEQSEIACNYQGGPGSELPAIHIGKHSYGWFFFAEEESSDDLPADIRALMVEARKRDCEYVMLDQDAEQIEGLQTYDWDKEIEEESTPKPEFDPAPYEKAASDAGFIIAENHVVNVGFYWRPDDGLSFSPSKVFPTAAEAWRHCCEVNDLISSGPDVLGKLSDELNAWCDANGLPHLSADELLAELINDSQTQFLMDFITRWDAAVEAERSK